MSSMYGDLDRPPLDAEVLRHALVTPGSTWTEVDVVQASRSTNAELSRRAVQDDRSGLVLIAEHQTAGRGRLDRAWTAPPRAGLTLSALVRPDGVAVSRWPWIPLLTGLAVAASVRSIAGVEAGLKWPNDVMVEDRKLAGILVERVDAGSQRPAAVIGIGLNVSLRSDELPAPKATSLTLEHARTADRSVLARAILRSLAGLLRNWEQNAGDADRGLSRSYADACTTLGRQVRLELPDGTAESGEAVGVDGSGRLLLRTAAGQRAFGAGDVVHLRSAT